MNDDRGSTWIAEIGGQRKRVLVLSNSGFARRASRVLIAPDVEAIDNEPRRAGWVGSAASYFDVARMTTLRLDRLLDHVGVVSGSVMKDARRMINEAMR